MFLFDSQCSTVFHGVPVYSQAFPGTHRLYPRMNGQVELTWVVGYMDNLDTSFKTFMQILYLPVVTDMYEKCAS